MNKDLPNFFDLRGKITDEMKPVADCRIREMKICVSGRYPVLSGAVHAYFVP